MSAEAAPAPAPAPADKAADRTARPWLNYLLRRLLRFVISLWVLITASFLIIHAIPGDPVRAALGIRASPQLVATMRHDLGLDRPIWQQYLSYFHGLVTGDLGKSMVNQIPVGDTIARLLPATISLAAPAFILTVVIAFPVGMFFGILTREGRRPRTLAVFGVISGGLGVVPDFLLGVLFVFLFAVTFQIFPVAGRDGFPSYVLPVIALAMNSIALLTRIVRVETQRVLVEDYMRTARAKRLPAARIYLRHALPNMLTAALTVSGLILGSLLAGTVLVETIFAWPGVGNQLVQSVLSKDYPMVQALALIFGGAALLINLTADLAIAVIDRRSVIRKG